MKNRQVDTTIAQTAHFSDEEVLELILNSIEEAFVFISKDLRIIHLNKTSRDKILDFFGKEVTPETSILELIPVHHREIMTRLYEDVFNGASRKTETTIPVKDSFVYVENYFKPVKNRRGEIIGALVISRDVTKNKQAELALKEAEERWRFALEGGNQGVWDWNVQTGAIFFSDSYKRLYGYADDDLKGRIEEWENMIHPEDKKKMATAIEDHLSSSDPYSESTYRVKTKDGNYKWVLGRGMLMRDEHGNPTRMIGTHTDITNQVKAEHTYKALFYNNSLPMWTYDLNTLRFLTVNDEAIKHYGYSKKEFLSMTIMDIRPEEDIDDLHELLEKRKTQGHIKRMSRHQKKDGEVIIVELTTYKFEDSDNVLVVAQDVTRRRYSEQILSLERFVFELSNRTDISLKYLVETLLKGFEKIHQDAQAALVLLKDDQFMEPFVAPSLPTAYFEKLSGIKIGPEEGSSAASMWQKQAVVVEDISSSLIWKRRKELALEFDLRSCWALPIIHTSGKVMGSFAVYYKKVKGPSTTELYTLERIRNIIRILMEYHWSIDEIKKANEQFDIVMKATHDLIWDWNLETNLIHRSALGLEKVYGISDNKSIETIEQWLLHLHPEDMERLQKNISDILQTKEQNTFDVEYRFRRDDGTYSHVYDRGMILRSANGKPVRMIGAAQNITERKILEEELLHNELEKQKAINQATVDSQEQERTEIGKELHDNVNQILTTTKLYLDLALSNTEMKDELIAKSSKNIISVINEIRQLSRSLMDPSIGDLGLLDSIKDLIENINLTRSLHVSLETQPHIETLLGKKHKLSVFRIIQEALNNAMKYAKASTLTICFKLYGDSIMLMIKDDGIGFDPSLVKMGAGLKNIQNRVYLMNGSYAIHSAPQKGCKIIINFPINTQIEP